MEIIKSLNYLMLPNPGHNRVYFESAKEISINELKALLRCQAPQIHTETIAQIQYIAFELENKLTIEELKEIGKLSSFYALFQKTDDNTLLPIDCGEWRYFPDNLNTILKYPGKTNEQFTRLMVNMAESVCTSKKDGTAAHLFDPLAGKGTTLFEGIIHGFNVTGMDIAKYDEECGGYFVKFLENGRYKHKASKESRSDTNGKKIASLFQVDFASEKEAYLKGDTQRFRFFKSDAILASQFIKKQSVDMVVSDLPYGVQHGSITKSNTNKPNSNKSITKSRNAEGIVSDLLPILFTVLKSGGSIVLAFNQFTTKKESLSRLLNENGFHVIDTFGSFLHRVDQAINRDIVIAKKP